jgi:hypothetical protein
MRGLILQPRKKERLDYTYSMHEAYYDRNRCVGAITQDPVEPFGETVEELRHSWMMMAEAFGQPILDYEQIPEPGYDREEDPLDSVSEESVQNDTPERMPEKGVSWEDKENGLAEHEKGFDEERYREQTEKERREQERIHSECFVGTRIMRQLMDKIYSDYKKWTGKDNIRHSRECSLHNTK